VTDITWVRKLGIIIQTLTRSDETLVQVGGSRTQVLTRRALYRMIKVHDSLLEYPNISRQTDTGLSLAPAATCPPTSSDQDWTSKAFYQSPSKRACRSSTQLGNMYGLDAAQQSACQIIQIDHTPKRRLHECLENKQQCLWTFTRKPHQPF
jgi:hypothetical protein